MDDIDYASIAGLLGGSLGTLLITAIINHFTKIGDHKRELIKLTYLRRLEIAENGVAFYSNYQYNIVQMRNALESIIAVVKELERDKDYDDFEIGIIQTLMTDISNKIALMFENNALEVQSVNLYFEFASSTKFSLSDFYNALGRAKSLDSKIEMFNNLASHEYDKGDSIAGDEYMRKGLDLLPQYIVELQKIIDILVFDSDQAQAVVKSIKSQIKVY